MAGNRQSGERETKRGKSAASLANLKGGSRKGIPNKATAALKDMILHALDGAHPGGGVAYLIEQAEKNPGPFLSLVGKVLPMTVTGSDGGAVAITVLTGVPRDDD